MKRLAALTLLGTILSVATALAVSRPAFSEPRAGAHAEAHANVKAPPGFRDACRRYAWLCAGPRSSSAPRIPDDRALSMARSINRHVNRSIIQVEDSVNYGVPEYWTLPDNGRGDCEDLALLKKKKLLDRGLSPRRLLLAVVLDRRGDNHTVLLLRLKSADVVLDSLTDRIASWNEVGYTFLAKQLSEDKSRWGVLLSRSARH